MQKDCTRCKYYQSCERYKLPKHQKNIKSNTNITQPNLSLQLQNSTVSDSNPQYVQYITMCPLAKAVSNNFRRCTKPLQR